MKISRALRITQDPAVNIVAAFVGGGGKTTAMFQLARELNASTPVIVTATAHLGAWQISLADQHLSVHEPRNLDHFEPRGITLVTGHIESNRTSPIDSITLNWLHAKANIQHVPLLIEADGSRAHPLKAPDEHEPPIPDFVEAVIVVAGLSGLGQPLSADNIHRANLFSILSGLSVNEPVTPEGLTRVLAHAHGGLKNIPASARRIVMLNQAESPELQSIGGQMVRQLLSSYDSVLVGSAQRSEFQVFEKPAGIVLAAGAATRFGRPKQLLDWQGQPFVRAVAQNALKAGLSPVIVVTGAFGDRVKIALSGLDVVIVENVEWQSGQASSIRAGMSSLLEIESSRMSPAHGRAGSSIFLLADQPHIGTEILRALTAEHARTLAPIIAPLVLDERRANPVLFDRDTFSNLLKLEGDVGGRAIFDQHRVHYLPWHDDRLMLDVDTPEDYARLIGDETL